MTPGITFSHPYPLCVIEVTMEVIYDSVAYTSLPSVTANYDLATGVFDFDTASESYLGKILTYKINAKAFTQTA